MKNLKKVLALVLAVVMIMGTVAVASAKDYADIKADSDYAEAIDVLSNLNILDGFKTGETYNFQPDGSACCLPPRCHCCPPYRCCFRGRFRLHFLHRKQWGAVSR